MGTWPNTKNQGDPVAFSDWNALVNGVRAWPADMNANGKNLTNLNNLYAVNLILSGYDVGALAVLIGAATNLNTPSTIVKRDAAGAFSAGVITATSFTGSGAGLSASTVPIIAHVAGDYSSKITSGLYSIGITGNAATATTALNGIVSTGAYTDPTWLTISKTKVGLSAVENTALSTWAGTANITTVGTLGAGVVPWARLSGVPATYTPVAHAASHAGAGSDPITSLGAVTTGAITTGAQVYISAAANTQISVNWANTGSTRWSLSGLLYAETGSNVGSDFAFMTWTDGGAYLATPFIIHRSTGNAVFTGSVTAASFSGAITGTTGSFSGVTTFTGTATHSGSLIAQGTFLLNGLFSQTLASALNDVDVGFSYWTAGADAILGPLFLSITGHPSATGTSRSFRFQAGDNVTYRSLVLNPGGGNVGIGTSYPNYTLDIGSAIAAGTYVQINAAAGSQTGIQFSSAGVEKWIFYRPANSSDLRFYDTADRITFQVGGNVGIGVTAPATLLHVYSNASGVYPTIQIQSGATANWPVMQFVDGRTSGVNWQIENGRTVGNFGIYGGNTSVQPFTILPTSGYVGIGTTTPSTLLHVAGGTSGSVFVALTVEGLNGAASELVLKGGDVSTNRRAAIRFFSQQISSSSQWIMGSSMSQLPADNGFYFNDSTNNNVMYFKQGGNVGIGLSSPLTKLHVLGTAAVPSLSADSQIFTVDNNITQQLAIGASPATPYAMWMQVKSQPNAGASYPLALNPLGGNVGIGTTAPGHALEIGDGGIKINRGLNPYLLMSQGGVNVGQFKALDATHLALSNGSGATAQLTVDTSTGNVGIGTVAPSAPLHISTNLAVPLILDCPSAVANFTINFSAAAVTKWQLGFAAGGSGRMFITDVVGARDVLTTYPNGSMTLMPVGGNVGIGTPTPGARLAVVGTGHIAQFFSADAASTMNGISIDVVTGAAQKIYSNYNGSAVDRPLILGTYVNQATQLVLDTTGNVGIGTTSPEANLTLGLVSGLSQTLKFNGGAGAIHQIIFNEGVSSSDGIFALKYDGTGINPNNKLIVRTSSLGAVLDTDAMTFQQNGNVGIGTTSPSEHFQLYGGNISVAGSGAEQNKIYTGWDASSLLFSVGTTANYVSSIAVSTRNYATPGIQFTTRSVERMRIDDSTGAVGIGITAPGMKLHVYDASTPVMGIEGPTTVSKSFSFLSGGLTFWRLYSPLNSTDLRIFDQQSSGDMVTFQRGGNVGIGTTTPAEKLSVISGDNLSTTNIAAFRSANLAQGVALSYNGVRQYNTNLPLLVDGNGTGDVYLQSVATGNVGIGRSSTSYKLHVTGDVGFTGILQLGSVPWARITGGTAPVVSTFANDAGYLTSASAGAWAGATGGINYAGGNVGIGTTTPLQKLDVRSVMLVANGDFNGISIGSTLLFDLGASTGNTYGRLSVVSGGGAAWNNLILQSGGGNVGIGTTAPAYSLTVGSVGTTGAYAAAINGGLALVSGANNRAGIFIAPSNATSSKISAYDYTAGAGLTLNLQTDNNSLIMCSNGGNVGIGTTSPVAPLTLATAATTSTTIGAKENRIFLVNNSSTTGNGAELVIGAADTTTGRYAAIGTSILANSSGSAAGDVYIATKALGTDVALTARLYVKANGNVGIGTTSPSYPLDVTGSARVSTSLYIASTTANIGGDGASLYYNSSNVHYFANAGVYIATLGQYGLSINNGITAPISGVGLTVATGKVGLGTTTPGAGLEIYSSATGAPLATGTAQTYGRMRVRSGSGVIDFGNLSSGIGWMQATDATNLATNYDLQLNPNGGNVVLGGQLNVPNQPHVIAQHSAGTVVSSAASWTTVPCANVYSGSGVTVDGSGRFVIVTAGTYEISGSVGFVSTINGLLLTTWFLNGVLFTLAPTGGGVCLLGTNYIPVPTVTNYFAAGTTIGIAVQQTTGANASVVNWSTFMSINRVA